MLTLILSLAATLALVLKFALADGDFTLMLKRGPRSQDFERKVVWITGASKGIGKVFAKQFASLGAKLVLSARNVGELEQVKAELIGKYSSCDVEIMPLDLSSGEESLEKAVQKAESYFSNAGVDYMIHNAAYDPHENALRRVKLGIKVTIVCPGPVDTLKDLGHRHSEKPVPVDRCVQLIITAVSHGLKEIWIAKQPVLLALYLVQYMPTIAYWMIDKGGMERVEALGSKTEGSDGKKKTV